MNHGFNHAAYVQRLAEDIPLRYRVPVYCFNCEEPIMPPCANGGHRFCPDCRATPEYRELVAR
jgi:hypothetical protein